MAEPTMDQVKRMRAAVLGAAAKVPGALIGLGNRARHDWGCRPDTVFLCLH